MFGNHLRLESGNKYGTIWAWNQPFQDEGPNYKMSSRKVCPFCSMKRCSFSVPSCPETQTLTTPTPVNIGRKTQLFLTVILETVLNLYLPFVENILFQNGIKYRNITPHPFRNECYKPFISNFRSLRKIAIFLSLFVH